MPTIPWARLWKDIQIECARRTDSAAKKNRNNNKHTTQNTPFTNDKIETGTSNKTNECTEQKKRINMDKTTTSHMYRENENTKWRNKWKIASERDREKKIEQTNNNPIGIRQFNGNLSTVIEQNSHKMVKFMSMETGSRTPLSAAHWYTPAWWRSTRSSISVELSDKCVDPEKISCKNWNETTNTNIYQIKYVWNPKRTFSQFRMNGTRAVVCDSSEDAAVVQSWAIVFNDDFINFDRQKRLLDSQFASKQSSNRT